MKKKCFLAASLAAMLAVSACGSKEKPIQQMNHGLSQSVENTVPSDNPTVPSGNNGNSETRVTKRLAGATAVLEGDGAQEAMEFTLKYGDKGINELTIDTIYYDEQEKEVRTFDGSLARCLTWLYYDVDGSEKRSRFCEYNAEGKLLRMSDDQWQSYYNYTYDADGNLLQISRKTDESENLLETYTYEFHENGQKKRIVETRHGDEPDGRILLYNEQGLLIEAINTRNGEPVSYECATYQYDDNGNLIKETGVERSIEYQYDAEGHLVRSNDRGEITEYRYDTSGRLIEWIEYAEEEPDELWSKTTYQYDTEGDLLQIITQWEDIVRTVSFRYEMATDFAFENGTLDDYVEYIKEEIFMYYG